LDLNRLDKGERIFLGASALLFILGWVKMWAEASVGPISANYNAWQFSFLGKLVVLLALAGVVIGALKAAGQNSPLPAVTLVGIGGLATLLMLLMLLAGPSIGVEGFGVDVDRGFLLFLGILVGAAMTYGGYLAMQAQATTGAGPTTPTV
jgi:hypothetical protein